MKIVTYTDRYDNGPFALTTEEFFAISQDERDSWSEWVWQDQPTKELALSCHDVAFEKWHADNEKGLVIKDFY